jgi:erythritol kinase (D-erythritol 1-phosphate-forming)
MATSLCIDAGTTIIKTVAYDADGREVHIARRSTRIDSPGPRFAEQDMGEVWDAVAATVREATEAAGEEVGLIGLTAQGDGCWLVDADGRPTGPAVLWNDGRAAAVVERWQQERRTERAFRINGSVGFAGLPHAILTWLAEYEPARVEAAQAALTCGGWLFRCLTGEPAIDESEAAAPWLDVARRDYSPEILELFDLGWAHRLLPPLRHDDERVAALADGAAERLGVAAGTPVVLAPYDLATSSVGAGAVGERQACSILGTTLSTQTVTAAVDVSGTPTGLTIPLGVDHLYLRALPTLAGTQVLAWAAGVLGVDGPAALSSLASEAAPGADGLVFLPYLSPAGERVPFVDPYARGSFSGLSFDHDRGGIARAVVEGLTYVIRECLEVGGPAPTELRACGGGASSRDWCQLIADVVGVPVVRSDDAEVGARGVFCFALVATGAEPDHATAAAKYVRVKDELAPDPARHATYDGLYDDFLAVRDDVSRSWPRLARARATGRP